jgi:hypothetical protein
MRRTALNGLLIAALALTGCQSSRSSRKVAMPEPPLEGAGVVASNDGQAVASLPPERPASFADRHPLFYKPRDYYDTTTGNRLSKTAAAAVIGVPAGIVGELRQIVAGRPSATVSQQ